MNNIINQRKALLYLLENRQEYTTLRFSYQMTNKRKLNRLSTKQLAAKKAAWDKKMDQQRRNYTNRLSRLQPAFGGVAL